MCLIYVLLTSPNDRVKVCLGSAVIQCCVKFLCDCVQLVPKIYCINFSFDSVKMGLRSVALTSQVTV